MKQNCIVLVRSDVFADLFKFGSMRLSNEFIFDGNVPQLKDNYFAFANLTRMMNPYDYTTEYLILHYLGEGNNCVKIEDLQAVYALDEEAQKKLLVHYDSRIRLQVSPWADKFKQRQIDTHINQSYKGVDNVWKIFSLSDEDRKKCDSIVGRDVVEEVFRELYDNKRPSGDLSPFVYLLRYERHSLYFKDTRGYFSDFIHVYLNCVKKQELNGDVSDETNVGSQINNLPENTKFPELFRVLEECIADKCKEIVPECDFYKVGPLFLYMKCVCGKGLALEERLKKMISHYAEKTEIEFSLAAYLLGLNLGYDGTYDCYYDSIGLKIFQDPVTPKGEESEPPFRENSDGEIEKLDQETREEKTEEITEQPVRKETNEGQPVEKASDKPAETNVKQENADSSGVELQVSTELFPEQTPLKQKKTRKKTTGKKKGETESSKKK